jgi:hypothetical protein
VRLCIVTLSSQKNVVNFRRNIFYLEESSFSLERQVRCKYSNKGYVLRFALLNYRISTFQPIITTFPLLNTQRRKISSSCMQVPVARTACKILVFFIAQLYGPTFRVHYIYLQDCGNAWTTTRMLWTLATTWGRPMLHIQNASEIVSTPLLKWLSVFIKRDLF